MVVVVVMVVVGWGRGEWQGVTMAADTAVVTAHAREQALPCNVHGGRLGGGAMVGDGGGGGLVVAALGNHRCAPEGRGREHTKVRGHGAHGIVASMAAAAIDGSVFSTPLLSG